jgi:hypothetical protein
MPGTPQEFIAAYEASLLEDVKMNPDRFVWKLAPGQTLVDLVPDQSAKMVKALRDGNATLNDRIKGLAKQFGIKPTQRDIRAFLNS